eukprot:Protomagalhaensia_wolfi_Nauph_80__1546@NODE_1946_length_1269_cov_101_730081_g1523_i0_p1_GENE_NODE_1946_length_1269_cov_101_730081_g1523_i0NODE_1946_length_1269_cov_101_730081_g1523_i0_p1_ORF_typecomplete_len129_score0_51_NODE_1946_length_1269_cov_101_730081_g1523_i0395781
MNLLSSKEFLQVAPSETIVSLTQYIPRDYITPQSRRVTTGRCDVSSDPKCDGEHLSSCKRATSLPMNWRKLPKSPLLEPPRDGRGTRKHLRFISKPRHQYFLSQWLLESVYYIVETITIQDTTNEHNT